MPPVPKKKTAVPALNKQAAKKLAKANPNDPELVKANLKAKKAGGSKK